MNYKKIQTNNYQTHITEDRIITSILIGRRQEGQSQERNVSMSMSGGNVKTEAESGRKGERETAETGHSWL